MQQNHMEGECEFRKTIRCSLCCRQNAARWNDRVLIEWFQHPPVIPHRKRGVVLSYLLHEGFHAVGAEREPRSLPTYPVCRCFWGLISLTCPLILIKNSEESISYRFVWADWL